MKQPLDPARISLVVTTYNWPEALDLVLESIARQTALPAEVLIADDGSAEGTARLVESWRSRFPVPLLHLWQEDLGFRAARSRNRAIAAASGDYIVMIDGDMVLERHFIADHAAAAEPGCFVQGVRLNTSPECSRRLVDRSLRRITPFTRGIGRAQHAVRSPLLSRLFSRKALTIARVKSCNLACWREDLLSVNGFDERMVGWGPEDKELGARLINAGVARKYLRFAALATHLYHRTRAPEGNNPNDRILEETLANRKTRCERGVCDHLAEFADGVSAASQPPWPGT